MTKVLIGVNTYPGHIYCRDEFVANLKAMVKDAFENGIDCKVLVVWNGQEKPKGYEGYEVITYTPQSTDRGIDILYKKQNIIRDYLLKGNYEYLYMVESDTLPPVDTITAHIKTGKDAVSCIYFVETQNHARITIPDTPYYKALGFGGEDISKKAAIVENKLIPTVWGIFGNKSRMWSIEDSLPQRGLVRAFAAGVGACLFKAKMFEKVEFKIRETNEIQQFTDFLLFKDLHDRGFELFVDTDRIAQHLHYDFTESVTTKWFKTDTMEATTPALPPYKSGLIQIYSAPEFDYDFKELKDLPAEKILQEADAILVDIPHWLSTGTLLGIVRDKKLIEWDTDIDIDVLGDTNVLELIKMFEDKGFKLVRTETYQGRTMQVVFQKEGVIIDIHLFWDNGFESYVNYNECGVSKMPHFLFDNLSRLEFNGYSYSVPQTPEAYLDIRYKDWKKVVKGRHWKTYTNLDERS